MTWLGSWFAKKSPTPRKRARRSEAFRPQLELLEAREVLATISSLTPSGAVTSAAPLFTWSALADADHYEIWVNDVTKSQPGLIDNQNVIGTSWTPTTPLHAGDSYRWWVRGLNATNTSASAWSIPLDFSISVLGAPTLIGPAGSLSTGAPTFSWNAVPGADHYYFWLNDMTTNTAGQVKNANVVGTSLTPATPLHAGDRYQWWVQALDSTGTNASAWSTPFDFAVATLGQPTLIGPTGAAASDTPTFTWNATAGADHYDIWVDDQTTGVPAILRNEDILGTSWTPTRALPAGDTFRWWVRALDSTGTNAGSWSTPLSFTVAALETPTPTGPTTTVTTAAPPFTWTDVAGADHYEIWVNDQTANQSAVLHVQNVLGTSYTPTVPLKPGDSYRWWVRAVDSTSTTSSTWSSPATFTVTALGTPTLTGPTGSITGAAPTYTWNAVAGAHHYELWVNDQTSGQSALVDDQHVTGTSWTTSAPLHAGDTYQWWVRALDSTSTNAGPWSNGLSYTVAVLATPTLISPVGSVPLTGLTFHWNAVTGADHYDIWVNDTTTGDASVLRNQNVHATSWVPTSTLHAGDKYVWWVRALDATGANASAWSADMNFVVAAS